MSRLIDTRSYAASLSCASITQYATGTNNDMKPNTGSFWLAYTINPNIALQIQPVATRITMSSGTYNVNGWLINMFGDSFYVYTPAGAGGPVATFPAYALLPNVWTRCFIVFNATGNTVAVYKNGVQVGATTAIGAWNLTGNDMNVGASASIAAGLVGFYQDAQIGIGSAPTAADVLADYTSGVVAPGCVHRWKFDQTSGTSATDSVGSTALTLTGGATFNTPQPWFAPIDRPLITNFANSVIFDGSSTTGTLTTPASYKIATKSIEFWAKANGPTTSTLPVFSTGSGNYYVGVSGTNLLIASYIDSGAVQRQILSGNNIIIPGKWQHYAYTFGVSGSTVTVTIYCDGVQVVQSVLSGGYQAVTSTTTYLGSLNGSLFFNGNVGTTSFYNVELTAAEVLFRAQRNNVTRGLVSRWAFTDGSGTTLTDSQGVANFTLTAPTWATDAPSKSRVAVSGRVPVSGRVTP